MEISEITIRNFKGIEEIRMGPIKPINMLIGRNNSGKSSVLVCIKLLNDYFIAQESNDGHGQTPMIKVPDEYFKKDIGEDDHLEVSITVKQTENEREGQFQMVVEQWNKQYERPRMDAAKSTAQLKRGLFDTLTFDFRASCKGKQFGLTSIRTDENQGDNREDVIVAQSQNLGNSLRCLGLISLFERKERIGYYSQPEFNDLSELTKQEQPNREVRISGGHLSSADLHCGVGLLNPAFEYIKNAFRSAFMVSPYRHGEIIATAQRCNALSNNGANIVNYLHDLHLNNYGSFQRIASFVKQIAPEVGNRLHPRFVQQEGSNLELAYEWPDGRGVNLANMGGGVEQLLILGCILIQQKTSCILWEEPESHLHPGAQDILLNELEKRIGDSRVFMTTHSPVFIRSSDKVAVHIITNPDGKSGKGRTLLSTELQEAATVLGSRPGHLAMADIVVYVEGKWGAATFEEWLKKWPDRDKVLGHLLLAIQFFSPDDMGTKDFDLSPLRNVTPNMIMFVDKDNEPGSSNPKETRKVLMDLCRTSGVPCITTDKRQIEDYFTEEAVRKILPTSLQTSWNYDASKPMGEQIPNGWKKYNAKIAAAMKWEDVEKHKDIMKVFGEIEKYAKMLRPETNVG
jgi:hypothetical protein